MPNGNIKIEKIGNTPLVLLKKICKLEGVSSSIYAKLEGKNPAGSIKDRVALEMILDAENSKKLKPGATVIEPTSGNTGIALAAICIQRKYKCIIVMPEDMSIERQNLIKKYGAEIILTPANLGMQGAIKEAEKLSKNIKASFIPAQFDNPANAKAHYKSTGPEIWEQTDGKIDAFVCGIGTGGTITGVGKFLKEKNPKIQIIAVEPSNSAVLSGRPAGSHKIQGIGAGFVPKVLDTKIYDKIVAVSDRDAFKYAKAVCQSDNVSAGISSGAALCASLNVAKSLSLKNVVVIFPDDASKYSSVF